MHGTIKPICVLDDDSSVLSSLKELLVSDGFEAETFDNPEEFLSYTQGHAVKLAVLDVWMPATNGIEVQERLRQLSPDTRVIIINRARGKSASRSRTGTGHHRISCQAVRRRGISRAGA